MLTSLFMPLLSFFVIDPVMEGIGDRLAATRAPAAIMQQVQACAATAPAALAERAAGDMWWGARTVVGVATGMTDGRAVLATASPACATVIAALSAGQPA